jgi:hypothetical protein
MKGVPKVLNAITDVVLAYRPKAKTKAAKKRKRLRLKVKKESAIYGRTHGNG